ncbi:hypothetical protein K440DRAFT_679766 [Wilcoxina mikolae CBS 423.85]|nr:hypothetical protein K440DRAFT_679766 [Wilcoxina mikolae CBS 423.85]
MKLSTLLLSPLLALAAASPDAEPEIDARAVTIRCTANQAQTFRACSKSFCPGGGTYKKGQVVTFKCSQTGDSVNGNSLWIQSTAGWWSPVVYFGGCNFGMLSPGDVQQWATPEVLRTLNARKCFPLVEGGNLGNVLELKEGRRKILKKSKKAGLNRNW